MKELKAKIEAILYCLPNGISIQDLATKCQIGSKGHVKAALESLKEDYEKRGAGLEIVKEDNLWKLKVRSEYLDLVKEIAKPEMETPIMETLAYIAWKGEIKQSSLVRVRGPGVYSHLAELRKKGFIEKRKKGSTYLIRPTKKFYSYFKLDENQNLLEIENDS